MRLLPLLDIFIGLLKSQGLYCSISFYYKEYTQAIYSYHLIMVRGGSDIIPNFISLTSTGYLYGKY